MNMNEAGKALGMCRGWVLVAGLLATGVTGAVAEENPAPPPIAVTDLGSGLYMLASGDGGNVVVSDGPDGVLIIDDEMTNIAPAIQQAVRKITARGIRFVVNTHWHFDHVGGNELFGADDALIMAHDNVRRRMEKGQRVPAFDMDIPPAAPGALPVLTFSQDVTLHWNGETVEVAHVPPAHTDGDALVYFRDANVVHMGDLFWNGMYPLVDASSGGSTAGMIAAVDGVLERIDDQTRVVPGHGPLGDRKQLAAFRDMLVTAHTRIAGMRGRGMSLEDVAAEAPLADLEAKWGGGFFKTDQWVGIVYGAP